MDTWWKSGIDYHSSHHSYHLFPEPEADAQTSSECNQSPDMPRWLVHVLTLQPPKKNCVNGPTGQDVKQKNKKVA